MTGEAVDPDGGEPGGASAASLPDSLAGNRDFLLFILSRLANVMGNQIVTVAVGWHVYLMTGDPLDLGLVGLSQFAPALALFLVAGLAADRFNRLTIIFACNAVQVVAAGLLLVGSRRKRHAVEHYFETLAGQHLSALNNDAIPEETPPLPSDKQWSKTAARVREVLEYVGLAERMRHKPGQLSGGEQQRVAIARALVNRPKLLLADEPTGELDEATGEQIAQLLQRLHRDGTAIVLVTHNPELATRASRQMRMRDGHLEEVSP